eukprot:GILJ01012247.1.p1 GENE.GILJ01012247.1~~GILJ01012247.1.p1  ORF type:complete len:299 (+),score=25.51 GILJ01012247.1:123-899(+)
MSRAALIGPSASPVAARQSSIASVQSLIQQMTNRWRQLDRDCSPNAVFALLYLYMTRAVHDKVKAGYFDDNDAMAKFTTEFASHYLGAYDAFYHGQGDPTPCWSDAFQYANSGRSSVTEDMFLGMNCHINSDLSQVVSAIGMPSTKRDYDRIDDVLGEVSAPASNDIASRYDPGANGTIITLLTPALMGTIYAWREGAWQNGMLLQGGQQSRLASGLVQTTIQTQATVYGLPFHSNNLAGLGASTAPARQAYCEAHHH